MTATRSTFLILIGAFGPCLPPFLSGQEASDTLLSMSVYFELNIDTIDAQWHPELDSIAACIKKHPNCKIYLTAYGVSGELNFYEIVRNRAVRTGEYLERKVGSRINPERVKLVRSEENLAVNRRVEILIHRN